MKIKLIVAASENNVIGIKNNLPWHLPDDMSYFKKITTNSVVIMGKNNYLSIPDRFRPLKNRTNIILTTNSNFSPKDCLIANSLEAGIELGRGEISFNKRIDIFIIGGGMVYEYAIKNDLVDIIYLTRIHANIKGDTFFPKIDSQNWREVYSKFHEKDEKHKFSFTFFIFKKLN